MIRYIFIFQILLLACKKPKDVPRTMSVTFFLKTPLTANQRLYVQYLESYDMSIPYQYGKVKSDTIDPDSFRVTVNYSAADSKIKGQAGYLKYTLINYQPWNHTTIAYAQPSWNEFGSIVNGVEQHNYGRDGVYNVTSVN